MDLFNDKITILKTNGAVFESVSSSVQKKIYINDTTIPIEAGDTIEHVLPSGLTKVMIATDIRVHSDPTLGHIVVEYASVAHQD